jgi:hypothetical protein
VIGGRTDDDLEGVARWVETNILKVNVKSTAVALE